MTMVTTIQYLLVTLTHLGMNHLTIITEVKIALTGSHSLNSKVLHT